MEKFVPYDKMSKKQKREVDRAKRGDWGKTRPATRVIPDTHKERRDMESARSREEEGS